MKFCSLSVEPGTLVSACASFFQKHKDETEISCFSCENALKALTGLIVFVIWVVISWKRNNYGELWFIEEAMCYGAILITISGLWIGYKNPLYTIPWVMIMRMAGLILIFVPTIMTGQINIFSCLYGFLFLGAAYGLFFGVIVAVLTLIPYLIYRFIHTRA